ncbi:MAG: SdrD B-like domain-containing protein [Gammaproteobacteria bacterium]
MSTTRRAVGRMAAAVFLCLSFVAFSAGPVAIANGPGQSPLANGGYIESMVWLDTNRDAIRDKSEVGMPGVTVSLLDCAGNFVRAQATDAKGQFKFNGLAAGCYRLRYAAMDGFRYCPANLGNDVTRDSNADPSTGLTGAIELGLNQGASQLDAGIVALDESQIGDRVWEDVNANGIQDVGEPGLHKVKVSLHSCSGEAIVDDAGRARNTRTNDSGFFVFEDIAPACYAVKVILPNGYAFSAADRTVDDFDSDVDPLTGMAQAGMIGPDQGLFGIDAGVYRNGSIGDWIWVDADGDHIQGVSERGLPGVQVVLLDAASTPTGRSEVSDNDGYYEFQDVAPGRYRLQFALPDGYFFGQAGVSPDSELDSDANGLGVTPAFDVVSGGQRVDIDVAARNDGIPRIDAEKLTNGFDADNAPGPFIEVGGDVLWEYILTNTGSGDLFDLRVVDDQGVSITCPQENLAEGETITCTGSSNDAQAGQYMNEVYACGAAGSPDGGLRCDKDLSHYFGSAPGISLEKATNGEDADTPTGPEVPAGSTVNWTYFVVNTGNVTLTDVFVTDDQGVTVTCPSMTLDPGVSMTCTGSGTAIAGQYANLGSVSGTPPVGDPVTATDPSHYFGTSSGIDIEKATNGADADLPTGPFVPVGGTVTWTYVVTNTGSTTLNDIVVSDSDDSITVSCPATTLAPGASFTCTATGTATAGQYANDSSVVGQGVDGDGNPVGDPVTDADPSHYFGADPSVDIEKATNGEDADTPTGPTLTEGDDVNWTYVVTNTGNITLVDLVVTDDQGVTVSCPSDTLAPGATFTCTGSGSAEVGQYANLGTVTGQGVNPAGDPIGDPVGDDDPSHYIGEPQARASLGDKVFKDLDADGQQDADEPGVPGIVVNLWTDDNGDGSPDTQIGTTTTDGDGMYAFTDLDPALTYVVQFVNDPAMNMPFTTPNVGNDASDSDAGDDGITGPIDLDPGENDPTIDAGIVNLPASLGDKVFKDLNGDGQQDANEPGVPGITVNLWTDDDGDGTPDTQIDTTITDGNGMYGFTDLDPTLTYVVQFVNDPAMNMPFTTPNVGDDATDSDAGDGGITGPINLASGENNPTIDAGLVNVGASLGDKVFKDLDADGQQDADEPGVPGITVNLWTDDDGDGSPDTQIATTTTDGNGMYAFSDLDPTLTYVVQFVNDPAMNMPFTTPNVGDDATDSDAGDGGITGPITLASGENNPTIDAGLVNLPASLGDKVFKDLDADGQQDADEPGVPGIVVNLWTDDDGDGTPDTQIATTTTDGNGMYGFSDLDPTLTYVVQFVNDPAMNMPFTQPNVGDDATDSDAGASGITGPINLASGENNPTIDAGLVNQTASLGDKVFKDLDADGQQDADEPGVPGITVNLWTDDDGDGTPDTQINTTTTDGNGMYGFSNLDPTLTYVVQFVNDPAMNMPFTTPNVGDDATDSDAGDGGITGPITLASGENNPTIDAGLVNLPASLGDKVFKDLDADGQQDADEPGIAGITVNLWTDDDGDGTPDTQIATTTTDGNGMYGFSDLDPTLTYVVQFVNDPAMNMPFTTPNVGDDATDSDAGASGITGPITLASGENNSTIDAGLVNQLASLGDKVFKDLDADGQQDAGEPGVGGITVNLWTDDNGDGSPDTQINSTMTDANGMYGFTNLDPALTYVVQFINDPAMNMPFTTPNVGDDASDSDAGAGGITGPINLASGENNPTIDAGLVNLPAKLGDFVWIDQDRDGIQDAGEPGVPGAVVNLWTDNDGDGTPDTQIATTTTDANGMYMFNNLNALTIYIVQFEAIPGKPFTTQTAGGDTTVDSNPDVNTGITAPVTLASGEFNPTIDAGVIMLNASIDIEKATNGEDADTPTGPTIIVGDAVNWTYVVTNTGELTLNDVVVTDDQGVAVSCPADSLAPGASFTCTGSGTATAGQYANLGSVTGQPVDGGEPVGDPVDADDPSHYFGEPAACVDKFVADNFDQVSYGNNDGDMNWSSNWDEHDSQGGGAQSGSVRIENGMLVMADYPNSGTDPSIRRKVDLTGFNAAMLMFDWSISHEADHSDQAVIEVRNSTTGWTELARYEGNSQNGNGGAAMFDISQFIDAHTEIRFRIANKFGGSWDKFMVDNVRIDKKCEACTPGDVADHFSHVSYGNNDGSMNWSGDWDEHDPSGGGAHGGVVRIENDMLVMSDYPNSGTHPEIRREVNLTGHNAAMLSFDWSISLEANGHDTASLWISSDGGHNWHLLDTFTGVHGQENGSSEMYDISAFISDQTVISFQISHNFGAVWDKFMVDNVRIEKKCEPVDPHAPQSCEADETHKHAFYLPNFNSDGVLDLYDLDPGATFVQDGNGNAVLSGRIRKQHEPSYAFDINVTMSGRTDNPPPGSPYNPYGADPADWQYYPNWEGSLTGADWNTGAHVSITRRGASFQIGTGANAHDGEQHIYGGSGWFDWQTSGQPHDCHYYGDCIAHSGNGDINVQLHCD